MKKVILIVMVLAALVTGLTLTMLWPRSIEPKEAEYEKNTLLVKFKEGTAPKERVLLPFGYVETGLLSVDFLNAKYRIDSMEPVINNPTDAEKEYGLDRLYLLKSTKDFDVMNALREYNLDPSVEYAEPNGILHGFTSFNGSRQLTKDPQTLND